MKKSSLLFAFAMFFMSFATVSAQKIATLDVAEILNLMPEKKKADQQLEAFMKASPHRPTQAIIHLGAIQQNIQQMTQVAQQDLAKRQNEAYAPIEKKVNDAVAKVAKANGWDLIFDTNTVGLVYKGGADATAAVKKELGL